MPVKGGEIKTWSPVNLFSKYMRLLKKYIRKRVKLSLSSTTKHIWTLPLMGSETCLPYPHPATPSPVILPKTL